MKKLLEDKLANLSATRVSGKDVILSDSHNPGAIEVAKRHATKDIVLWLIAIAALISATLVNQYLPAYWQPANDLWTRIAVISGLILLAIGALALTHQGKTFKILVLDSQVELRRVTWPTKAETLQYTWQVALMTGLLALLVWLLDTMFGQIVKFILG